MTVGEKAVESARYEVEHVIATIIGPTEVGEDGFYRMMQAQMALDDYAKAVREAADDLGRRRIESLEAAARGLVAAIDALGSDDEASALAERAFVAGRLADLRSIL